MPTNSQNTKMALHTEAVKSLLLIHESCSCFTAVDEGTENTGLVNNDFCFDCKFSVFQFYQTLFVNLFIVVSAFHILMFIT
jgi:hypothetical protein